ncbi:4109_t:CDS:2, partial [Entrophospora sp. SA101]
EQLEGKSGASSRGNSSSNSSISHLLENGDALNWVSRGTRTFTLKKLECLKQAFCLNTLAWNNKIGRHDSILLVSRITESDDVNFLMTRLAPYGKPKCLGSGGSMVARLKLKGIDGRAPPGVDNFLEGLSVFNRWKFEAITGMGNLLKLYRAGDRALQLSLFNEESLVS